jgi:AbrB family looped-hinge helix DNA binding protein
MGIKKLYRSKIAANGQLVLPKELRESLGLSGGEILVIQAEDKGNGNIEVTLQRPRTAYRTIIGLLSQGGSKTLHEDWAADLKRADEEEMK